MTFSVVALSRYRLTCPTLLREKDADLQSWLTCAFMLRWQASVTPRSRTEDASTTFDLYAYTTRTRVPVYVYLKVSVEAKHPFH